jgi:mRNA interferase HigB
VHVIKRQTLIHFYEKHADAKGPLEAWWYEAKHANWGCPADIKMQYRDVSILKDNRVIFNIGGNKYRLVVKIHYATKIAFIRFIGTHKEYEKIDAEVI